MSDPIAIQIPYDVRNQHIYIPGKTRHGKSTLINTMAAQDIENGAGVCVIDPKGDLVASLLEHVPTHRKDDCIYLSTASPVPINFMDAARDEQETLVGEMKYVITRGTSAEQAPLMDAIITDLIYTLLNANETLPTPRQATFIDIYRFLANETRRDEILDFVTDRELKHRWKTNFPNPKDCTPTLTRMTPFIRNPSLRKLFDCPAPKLNIAHLMDTRKILLVDLGGISESTKILATLLIAKIRQAAFRRASLHESKRIPFFLYVDEFEFFQTSDFDQILSFAGGYGLRLTLANQFIGQLDTRIRQSIFGNIGSFIVFCLSPDDAKHFKHITPYGVDIAHLPKYEALYKVAGKSPITKPTPPPLPTPNTSYAEYIKKRTLDKYACKISEDSSKSNEPDARKGEGSTAKVQHVSIHPKRTPPRTANPRVQDKPDSEFFE